MERKEKMRKKRRENWKERKIRGGDGKRRGRKRNENKKKGREGKNRERRKHKNKETEKMDGEGKK